MPSARWNCAVPVARSQASTLGVTLICLINITKDLGLKRAELDVQVNFRNQFSFLSRSEIAGRPTVRISESRFEPLSRRIKKSP